MADVGSEAGKYGLTAEIPEIGKQLYKQWEAGTKQREEAQKKFAESLNPNAKNPYL